MSSRGYHNIQTEQLRPHSSRSLPRQSQTSSLGRQNLEYQIQGHRQRLPRSADPSPQRTSSRLETLNELHGGPLSLNPNVFEQGSPGHLVYKELPRNALTLKKMMAASGGHSAHHHHQVLYVCHGQCSGPKCDFTQTTRQCQSLVWMDNQSEPGPVFQSEVVAMTDSSLRKLDEKKQSLEQMKQLLAGKLKSKQRKRQKSGKPEQSPSVTKPKQHSVKTKPLKLEEPRKKEEPLKLYKPAPILKVQENLQELSCHDLLDKSHQDLVLLLIHLRRQAAALNESVDASRSELQNMNNKRILNSDCVDKETSEKQKELMGALKGHIRELEEQVARGLPMVNLVENMVKLASLYKGPEDAPLSHRVRNIPVEKIQHLNSVIHDFHLEQIAKQRKEDIQQKLEELYHIELTITLEAVVIKYLCLNYQDHEETSLRFMNNSLIPNYHEKSEDIVIQQNNLVKEMEKIRLQLQFCQMRLDGVSTLHSIWENDLLMLRQQLQTSASRDLQFGLGQSAETLNIESELAHVHQHANELHKKRIALSREIETITQKPDPNTFRISQSPYLKESAKTSTPTTSVASKGKKLMFQDQDSLFKDRLVSKTTGSNFIEPYSFNKISPPSIESITKNEKSDSKIISPTALHNDIDALLDNLAKADINNVDERVRILLGILPKEVKDCEMRSSKPMSPVNFDGSKSPSPNQQFLGTLPRTTSGSILCSATDKTNIRPDNLCSQTTGLQRETFPFKQESKISDQDFIMSPLSSPDKSLASSYASQTPTSILAKLLADDSDLSGKETFTSVKKRYLSEGDQSNELDSILKDQNHEMKGTSRSTDLDRSQITPDIIRSTIDKNELSFIEFPSIDNLFSAPDKIKIPERYIPEVEPDNLTQEERNARQKKVDSIRKLLSGQNGDGKIHDGPDSDSQKQRQHLLDLNQIIAQQVMEKSRMVAVRALANKKFDDNEKSQGSILDGEEDDRDDDWSLASINVKGIQDLKAFPVVQNRDSYLY